MLKATCAVLALFLLATQLPELSSAKNGLNSKRTLGRVLSIVSAVDLTLRYTHGKISVIESHVKQLKNENAKLMKMIDNVMRMLRKASLRSITICEHRAVKVSCKAGKYLKIMQARYGRSNKRTCNGGPIYTTNCRAANSLAIVRKYCHGKVSCVLRAHNSVFGDPCRGTYKYLTVKYRCSK